MKVSVAIATVLYFLKTEASPAPRTYYDDSNQDTAPQEGGVVGVPVFIIVVPRQDESQPSTQKVKNFVRYADPSADRDDYGVSVDYLGLDLGRQLKIEDDSGLQMLRMHGACMDFRVDCLRYCKADRSCRSQDCDPMCNTECRKMVPCDDD